MKKLYFLIFLYIFQSNACQAPSLKQVCFSCIANNFSKEQFDYGLSIIPKDLQKEYKATPQKEFHKNNYTAFTFNPLEFLEPEEYRIDSSTWDEKKFYNTNVQILNNLKNGAQPNEHYFLCKLVIFYRNKNFKTQYRLLEQVKEIITLAIKNNTISSHDAGNALLNILTFGFKYPESHFIDVATNLFTDVLSRKPRSLFFDFISVFLTSYSECLPLLQYKNFIKTVFLDKNFRLIINEYGLKVALKALYLIKNHSLSIKNYNENKNVYSEIEHHLLKTGIRLTEKQKSLAFHPHVSLKLIEK